MKFNVNQQDLQQALNYCQGVIEKRSTLPILSNILLHAKRDKLTITATDLDLIFIHQIENIEVLEEGKTTTTSSIMYDIIRKFSSEKKKEILICPYTLTEVINAIIYAGGKPVYVEIDIKNGLPLEDDLNKKINNNTKTHL